VGGEQQAVGGGRAVVTGDKYFELAGQLFSEARVACWFLLFVIHNHDRRFTIY
jgi:hypothetical protein